MNFSEIINFDQQATTAVNRQVLDKMLPYFSDRAGNPHSADHAIGWESSRVLTHASAQIGGLIGADPDEILFTSGATEANNLALIGLGRCNVNNGRRKILVSAIEHKCVLAAARALSRDHGYEVVTVPVDSEGRVRHDLLNNLLDEEVLLVSIMAVNNEIGTIQDIEALATSIRSSGAIFHCDAAQAPLAMDMKRLAQATDLLSLSAHKMYGPQGIGVLYVHRSLQGSIEPILHGGGQQNGLRSGTAPLALCVGMGEAAALLGDKRGQAAQDRLLAYREYFVEQLHLLPWELSVNGPTHRHPGNANLRWRGFSSQDVLQALQPHLAASTGSACTSGIFEPSHVLRAIGLTGEEAEESIRFSLGFNTTKQEIDKAIDLIESALQKLSSLEQSA